MYFVILYYDIILNYIIHKFPPEIRGLPCGSAVGRRAAGGIAAAKGHRSQSSRRPGASLLKGAGGCGKNEAKMGKNDEN